MYGQTFFVWAALFMFVVTWAGAALMSRAKDPYYDGFRP